MVLRSSCAGRRPALGAGVLPSDTRQGLRELTRARCDLVQSRTAARQRLQDESVVVFPELPPHPAAVRSGRAGAVAVARSPGSAHALTAAPAAEHSADRRGGAQARAPQGLARDSAISRRAVRTRAAREGALPAAFVWQQRARPLFPHVSVPADALQRRRIPQPTRPATSDAARMPTLA